MTTVPSRRVKLTSVSPSWYSSSIWSSALTCIFLPRASPVTRADAAKPMFVNKGLTAAGPDRDGETVVTLHDAAQLLAVRHLQERERLLPDVPVQELVLHL